MWITIVRNKNVRLSQWFLDGLRQHFVHIFCTNQFNPKTEDSSSNKKLEHSLLYDTGLDIILKSGFLYARLYCMASFKCKNSFRKRGCYRFKKKVFGSCTACLILLESSKKKSCHEPACGCCLSCLRLRRWFLESTCLYLFRNDNFPVSKGSCHDLFVRGMVDF